MTRILVTGSRGWTDKQAVADALERAVLGLYTPAEGLPVLVHGACPTGADAIADELWLEHGYPEPERHPAEWSRFGRAAGPLRNQADGRPRG